MLTSLSESEVGQKHVGKLKIHKKNFKLQPIPLRSVRPFMMDNIILNDTDLKVTDRNLEIKIENLLIKKIDEMIKECDKNRHYHEKQPQKPLLRIKVDYTNFETINENRFAQKIVQKVANPRNVLQFFR